MADDTRYFADRDDTFPLFDRDELNGNTLSDSALQRELFDLYFGQAPSLFNTLQLAIASGDQTSWVEAAHALKGTARTLGLMKLGEVAADAEGGAPNAELFTEFQKVYACSVAAAEAYLGSVASAA